MKLQFSKEWYEKNISADENFKVGACNPMHLRDRARGENRPPLKKRIWRYHVRIGKVRIDLSRIETSQG